MSTVSVPRAVSAPVALLGFTCLGFVALTGLYTGLMWWPSIGLPAFVAVAILLPAAVSCAGGVTLFLSGHRWAATGLWLGTLVAVAALGLLTLWDYGMQTSRM